MNGLLCSNVLAPNENGDTSPEGVNAFTLGLKSRISDAGIPSMSGKSLVYLSKVYELTLNMSPVVALDTWYRSNITKSFLDGIADFSFLTILE